jgi:hypothetical protein
MLGNEISDDGGFSRAGNSGNKDVVSGALHVQPKFDGLDRPLLTDDLVKGFNLRGIFELKNPVVAYIPKVGRFYFEFFGHMGSPLY